MNTALSPIVSEFDTEEQAASHDLWFRAQVQKALDNTDPRIPHDQVMAEMRELVQSKKKGPVTQGSMTWAHYNLSWQNFARTRVRLGSSAQIRKTELIAHTATTNYPQLTLAFSGKRIRQ